MNWFSLRVEDSVFVDAQLDELRCWGIEVIDCDATRASLRYAQIGSIKSGERQYPRSRWCRVDLQRADVRQLQGNVVFEDVDLRHARFGRTSLGWSDLTRVRFGGKVDGLWIGDLRVEERPQDWTLREVDLTEAVIAEIQFLLVDLGVPEVDMRLPEDHEHWLITDWRGFLARVLDRAPPSEVESARIWADHQSRALGPRQTMGFVAVRDARRYGGEAFVRLLESAR